MRHYSLWPVLFFIATWTLLDKLLCNFFKTSFFRVFEGLSKYFFDVWVPFVLFCAEMTPHIIEVQALGRPIHDWLRSIVCFSIQLCFYYIGNLFDIVVMLKNEAVNKEILSRWHYCWIKIWCVSAFVVPSALKLWQSIHCVLQMALNTCCCTSCQFQIWVFHSIRTVALIFTKILL